RLVAILIQRQKLYARAVREGVVGALVVGQRSLDDLAALRGNRRAVRLGKDVIIAAGQADAVAQQLDLHSGRAVERPLPVALRELRVGVEPVGAQRVGAGDAAPGRLSLQILRVIDIDAASPAVLAGVVELAVVVF